MSESAALGILTTDTSLVVRSWNEWQLTQFTVAPLPVSLRA